MKYIEVGKTREKLPAIGIGTWQLDPNSKDSINAIRASIESGSNFVDTAEAYRNEQMVGKAIKEYDDIFLATKVWPTHFRHDKIIKACDQSLERLGRKYIDLYQLHWPNPKVSMDETMSAMEKLVDDGKIRHIGVSNFSVEQLRKAQNSLKKYEVVSNQVEYSIMAREYEKDLLPYCQENGITLIAYSPLGHGKFFTRKNKAMPVIQELAKKHDKTPAQIALNWLISRSNVSAIPKAGSIDHVKQNIDAANFQISSSDLTELDQAISAMNFKTMKQKYGWLISFVLRLV